MSTHNIGFYEDLTKIIFELSSNMHLISSADSLRDDGKTDGTMISFHRIFLNFQTLLNVAVVTVKLIYHKIMPNYGSKEQQTV